MLDMRTKELRRRRATLLGVVLAPEDSVDTLRLLSAMSEIRAIDCEIRRRATVSS